MREYVLTLLVTAAVTYVLTPLVLRGAIKAGAVLAVRDRDVHVVPIPRLGGLAMYAGLAVGLLVAAQMSPLDSVLSGSNMAIGLLLAGGLVVAMGAIDDRWGMNAISKLAGQVAAGVILVASGCELGWLPLPGGGTFSPTSNQALVLTVLVVVATINAVNFIDGLDGLAAGIVAIAAISFFLYYYSLTHTLRLSAEAAPTLASALLAGMCLGFLPHNFFPARIFMGDTGSMLLGLLLAYVPISSITSLDPRTLTGAVNRFPEVLPLLLPTTILVIPYADMLMAVVRRTRAGLSPFAADRKHLHHRLLDIGHSHRLSVLIMYLWAAMFSGLIVWFSTVRTPLFAFAVITLAAVLSLMLMSMPRLRWWQRSRRRDLAPAAAAAGQGGPAAAPGAGPAAGGPAGAASLGGSAAAAGAPVLTREPVDQPGASDWFGAGSRPGDRRAGELLSGGRPPGSQPSDELLAGGLPTGERSSGELLSGERLPGELPPGELLSGERSSGELRSGGPASAGRPPGTRRSAGRVPGESPRERFPAERFPGAGFPPPAAGRGEGAPGRRPAADRRTADRPAADRPAEQPAPSIWEPALPPGPDSDLPASAGDPGAAPGSGRSLWEPARRAGQPGPRTPGRGRPADRAARWQGDASPAGPGADPAGAFPGPGPARALPGSDQGRAFREPDPGRAIPGSDPGRGFREPDPGRGFREPDPGRGFPGSDPGRGFPGSDPGRGFHEPDPGRGFPGSGRAVPEPDPGRAFPEVRTAARDDLTPDIPPIPPAPPARPTRSVVGTIPPAAPFGAPPPDPLNPDISGPDTLSDDAMSASGLAPDPLAPDPRTAAPAPGQPDGRPAGQGAAGDEETERSWSRRRPPRTR